MKDKASIRRRILSVGVSIALAALMLGMANAGSKKAGGKQSASNGNGTQDIFSLADANHDGLLSREEAGDYLVYMVFAARDKNRDGVLTEQEWAAGDKNQIEAFKQRDMNDDGVVTLQEALLYGRRGAGGLTLLKKADTNGDGKLSRAEIDAYLRQQQ